MKQTQVKSQATTTARSACTVEQQWRWHQLINHVDDEHRKLNASDDTGVEFMEVEAAFKVNGDEEGLLACANDGIKVYGCGSRDKHEKNTQDSRDSISLFKCGSAAGWSGPTIFLLKGKKAPVGLDSAYLVKHGRRKIRARRRQLLVRTSIESKFARQSGTSRWGWMR